MITIENTCLELEERIAQLEAKVEKSWQELHRAEEICRPYIQMMDTSRDQWYEATLNLNALKTAARELKQTQTPS